MITATRARTLAPVIGASLILLFALQIPLSAQGVTRQFAVVSGHFGRISLMMYGSGGWTEVSSEQVDGNPHGVATYGSTAYVVRVNGYVSKFQAVLSGESATLNNLGDIHLGDNIDAKWAAIGNNGQRLYVTSSNRNAGTLWQVETGTSSVSSWSFNWNDPIDGYRSLEPDDVITVPSLKGGSDQVFVAKRGYTGCPEQGVRAYYGDAGMFNGDQNIGGGPNQLAYWNNADYGQIVFAGRPQVGGLAWIEATTGAVNLLDDVGFLPDAMVALGNYIYIVGQGSDNIRRFTLTKADGFKAAGTVSIEGTSTFHDLTVSPDGDFLLLASPGSGKLSWVRLSDFSLDGSVNMVVPEGVAGITPDAVPEPATLTGLAACLMAAFGARRRRLRKGEREER